MKKIIITLICVIFYTITNAQIGIVNSKQIEIIKKTTLIIPSDIPEFSKITKIEDIFSKYWTLTPFQFVKKDELKKYLKNEKYTVFTSEVETNTKTNMSGQTQFQNTHSYLYITCYAKTGAKKESSDGFGVASILLDDNEKLNNILLKNYLQIIQNCLIKGKDRESYDEFEKKSLKKLKSDTLFIKDFTVTKYSAFKMGYDKTSKMNISKYFDKYPNKLKILNEKEFNEQLEKSGGIYLNYIKSSTFKYLMLIDSKTGEVLYSKVSQLTYGLKKKDIKKLIKVIQKG